MDENGIPLCVLNRFSTVIAARDHVTNDSVHDVQHAIELCDGSRIGFKIDEGVVSVREAVDFVGQLALAPLLDIVDLAALLRDNGIDALLGSQANFLFNGRIDKEQQFVSLHLVTSSGLNGFGL